MPLIVTPTEHNSADYAIDPRSIALLWRMEDRHFWHRARNQWIERALLERGVTPPASLLEVGCGSGAVAGYLHNRGYNVTGVDTAAPLLIKAHERFPDVNFVVCNVERLAEGPFDAVGLFDVLEHLEDPDGMLATCRARARPGSVFAATVPAQMAMHTVIDDLSGHKRRFEVGDLAALFARAGLVDIEERGIFRATAGLQNLARSDARGQRAEDLDDDQRHALFAATLRVPATPLNFALNALCAVERVIGFEHARNRPGASLLATGRIPI